MSRLAVVLLVVMAVLAVVWGFAHLAPPERDSGAPTRTQASVARPRGAAAVAGDAAKGSATSPEDAARLAPLRDLFAYADYAPAPPSVATYGVPTTQVSEPPLVVPTPLPTPTPLPVRLVGFVRRSGTLRAALSIHGDIVLAARDDLAANYLVVALDEDTGVRLRAPGGTEFTLRP